jgi:membrane protease subunit (stomatin/prohibitin family)
MNKYKDLRNQVVWAVTHYGIVNTDGIMETLKNTVLELDSEQLQKTLSNSDYAKCAKCIECDEQKQRNPNFNHCPNCGRQFA